MQPPCDSRARPGILACLILLAASLAAAKDGRDFAGFYEVSEVVEFVEEFQVTLTVRVFNYSGTEVNGKGRSRFAIPATPP